MIVEDQPLYDPNLLSPINFGALASPQDDSPPRILSLYGSLRPQRYLRVAVEEVGRVLRALGRETKIFDPVSLPLPDILPDSHPKAQELRELALWS